MAATKRANSTKRVRTRRRGPMGSASEAFIEGFDGIAEVSQVFRRVGKISNTLLKSVEIDVYQDAIEDLEDRGLTRAEAITAFDEV